MIGSRMMNNFEILSRIAERNNLKFLVEPDNGREVSIMEGLDNFGREDECIFAECTDSEVTSLLTAWLTDDLKGDRDLEFQLARLLAARGGLVGELAAKIIREESWNGFNCKQMFLAYICNIDDFKTLLAQYLATMPCDFRDGLFIAAMHAESHEVDDILINAFSEWYKSGDWFPAGTGEDGWLEYFLKKWIKVYSLEKIEVPLRAYFDICV